MRKICSDNRAQLSSKRTTIYTSVLWHPNNDLCLRSFHLDFLKQKSQ